VQQNQIAEWKKQLLERAGEIFERERKTEGVPSVKELHAKIGRLAMENDFYQARLGALIFSTRIRAASLPRRISAKFFGITESRSVGTAMAAGWTMCLSSA
jgi:hypothetical protein